MSLVTGVSAQAQSYPCTTTLTLFGLIAPSVVAKIFEENVPSGVVDEDDLFYSAALEARTITHGLLRSSLIVVVTPITTLFGFVLGATLDSIARDL